jgi:hypothetical protein
VTSRLKPSITSSAVEMNQESDVRAHAGMQHPRRKRVGLSRGERDRPAAISNSLETYAVSETLVDCSIALCAVIKSLFSATCCRSCDKLLYAAWAVLAVVDCNGCS